MRRWIIIVGILGIIAIGAIWYIVSRSNTQTIETVTVSRTTVEDSVDFTGSVQAQNVVTLGFEVSGTVESIAISVGDAVTAGDRLVTLTAADETLSLAKAFADRVSAQIASQTDVTQAQETLNQTKAENALSVEKLRQAVRNAKSAKDQQAEIWQQAVRDSGSESLSAKQQYSLLVQAEGTYVSAQKALESGIRTAEKSNAAAQQALQDATTTYQTTTQAAPGYSAISSLEATEELARLQLSKHRLVAPFSGVITERTLDKGEFVTAGTGVVTLLDPTTLVVEAMVAETDIANLKTGMPATVTLDAFPETGAWDATLTHIDPSAQIIEGIPTYKVTLQFASLDERFRPGFTATVTMHIQKKDNVLAVQRRVLVERDSKTYVHVLLPDGTTQERLVTTGLLGSDGLVEITSGLQEGEQVVIRLPANE